MRYAGCQIVFVAAFYAYYLLTPHQGQLLAQGSDAEKTTVAQTAPDNNTDTNTGSKKKEFSLPAGLEWETNNEDPVWASSEAKKGGVYKSYLRDFPPTLRQVGPESNSGFRSYLSANDLGLLRLHPGTQKWLPSLATHWAVASDNKTVYFKLDGRAKWSDGKPVTAEDFLFTLEFMRSPHIVAPWYNDHYTKEISKVVKHSDEVISVVSGKEHIKYTLLQITGIGPTPRQFYKLDKDFVTRYNWKVKPNTGPYKLSTVKKGKFVVLERKKDWWGKDYKYNKNLYNFDKIHLKVIREPEVRWQSFLRGDLTAYSATFDADYWYQKSENEESFKKGYINKLWFYYQSTQGANQVWINSSLDKWKDPNVRHAFAHALNFDLVITEVLRGDPSRLKAFMEGYGAYDNKDISYRPYDIEKASLLMKKSGWTLGERGHWQKDGREFDVMITFWRPIQQSQLVVLQNEAKKAGFKVSLDLLDGTAGYKEVMEKNFDVGWLGFNMVGDVPPPGYWQFLHSENAKPQTNNISMISNPELDKLTDEYRNTFDEAKKQALSRQILQLVYDDGSIIPGLIYPFDRVLYWKGYKYPEVPGTRTAGISSSMMWFDPAEASQLDEYRKAKKSFGVAEVIDTTYKLPK